MKVTVTVTRSYEMDEQRILAEPSFDPPAADAPRQAKRLWLAESFFELCGFGRDQDHVDGSYVRYVTEVGDNEFQWPETLR